MEKQFLKHFRNFKKYDKSGRRLAIFADLIDDKLRFYVFRCSKGDVFEKKVAIKYYEDWKNQTIESWIKKAIHATPLVFDLKVDDIRFSKNTFLQYCNYTFCEPYGEYKIVNIKYLSGKEAEAQYLSINSEL